MKGFVENPHVHDLVPESVKNFHYSEFFHSPKETKDGEEEKKFLSRSPAKLRTSK